MFSGQSDWTIVNKQTKPKIRVSKLKVGLVLEKA